MQKYLIFINTFLYLLLWAFADKANAYCYNGSGCTCSVSVTGMSFGIYNPVSKLSVTTTASISVSCTASTAGAVIGYDIILGPGNSGNYALRQMNNGSDILNYNIYTGLLYQNIWGDNTSGTQNVSDSYLIAQIQSNYIKSYTAYSLIPASQNIPGGIYSDNILVTINF